MKWYPIDSQCILYNSRGNPYEDLTCLYPVLKHFYHPWEVHFIDSRPFYWMVDHPEAPVIAVGVYLLAIVAGRKLFALRPAWNWRTSLAFWNFSLSAFSLMGLLRMLPPLFHIIKQYTWRENYCIEPESHYGSGASGLWVLLFVWSKFPELFDTLFIVVHKKPLIFLHWYHHVSVLLFCWQSYVSMSPLGIVFCVMNYAVHSFMYFYYFLMAIHKKPNFINAVYITLAQISQMVVGVAVTLVGCYLIWFDKTVATQRNTENECSLQPKHIMGALILYGSYLVLFLQFFIRRYFKKSKRRQTKASLEYNVKKIE